MSQEIIIGLTGGIGVEFDKVVDRLKKELKHQDAICDEIRLSEFIRPQKNKIRNGKEIERIRFLMDEVSELRKNTNKKSLMALLSVLQIYQKREENSLPKYKYKVYILNSLKRPEESDLLRHIYGRNFILVSVHSSEDKRIKNILKKDKKNKIKLNEKLEKIHELIDKDFKENDEKLAEYGQNVSGTYPSAHFFVDTETQLEKSIERFVDILFGYPYHTPTIDERNMFTAKGISFRSADLSRQVGAVIADRAGNIIATGCNDVPKFGGGLYEPNDPNDKRDFQLEEDTNVEEKKLIITDLIKNLKQSIKQKHKSTHKILDEFISNEDDTYEILDKMDSKITNILEFGRSIHAELAAICDASKRGVPLSGTLLYCTTFPCHLCIKHILAVGIKRIVYIDPYPKSKAELHFDESITHLKSESCNKILLDSFIGISPRRFMHVFRHEKGRKLDDKITPKKKKRSCISPYLISKSPIGYFPREIVIIKKLHESLTDEDKIKIEFPDINIDEEYESLKNKFEKFEQWANEYWDDAVR